MKLWELSIDDACWHRWVQGYKARGGEGTPPWPPTNLDNKEWLHELYEELVDGRNYLFAKMGHFGRDTFEWPMRERKLMEYITGSLQGVKVWIEEEEQRADFRDDES